MALNIINFFYFILLVRRNKRLSSRGITVGLFYKDIQMVGDIVANESVKGRDCKQRGSNIALLKTNGVI